MNEFFPLYAKGDVGQVKFRYKLNENLAAYQGEDGTVVFLFPFVDGSSLECFDGQITQNTYTVTDIA